jgi:hypothetical protein
MSRMSCQVSESKIHNRAKLKVFLCVCLFCYIREVTFKDKETYIYIAMVLETYISFLKTPLFDPGHPDSISSTEYVLNYF